MKKFLSILCVCSLVLGLFALCPTAAEEGWDGESISMPQGEGSFAEPYLISCAEELAWVSYMTRNPDEANALLGTSYASHAMFSGACFRQTADVDLGGNDFVPIGTTQANAKDKRNAFAGSYDGGSYAISNAVIAADSSLETTDRDALMVSGYAAAGLFGVLGEGAEITYVNAKNVKVGWIDRDARSAKDAYGSFVAGVIAGTTCANASISHCSTDEDCAAFGVYAAGGILGMSEAKMSVSNCLNRATVSSDQATGGIVGAGYVINLSYCVNEGSVEHFTFTRWSGAGGIMGVPLGNSTFTHCVNSADASVSAISVQPNSSKNNRVAIGGIVGNDNYTPNAEVSYTHCYNLQTRFEAQFIDNGNTEKDFLAVAGGIAGYAKDGSGGGKRTMEQCYSVAGERVIDVCGNSSTVALNFNLQDKETEGGAINPLPYAGLICAELSEAQVKGGFGSADAAFATCQYGISAEDLIGKEGYSKAVDAILRDQHLLDAPAYVGVQETLARDENYALRFIFRTAEKEYYEAGAEVVAIGRDGKTESFTVKAERYYKTLTASRDSETVLYSAEDFDAEYLMALTLESSLAEWGAVVYTVTPYCVTEEGETPFWGRSWTVFYDENGEFLLQSCSEISVDVDDSYSIVYPEDSVNAAVYTAITLQNHFLTKGGLLLPLRGEGSLHPSAKEILIVEDPSVETGCYTIAVQNNRLVITAGDMFGFIGAADYLVSEIFVTGELELTNACNYSGRYEREMLTGSVGEYRVMFHNVWFRSFGSFDSPTSYQYELALVAAYQPDVIGFNEFDGNWRSCGFIEAMEAIGYVEAKPTENDRVVTNHLDPIFYNTATTELIEGSAKFLSYGNFNKKDADGDGIQEPVLRENGKYYDNSSSRWLGASAACFRDKTTGKAYSVCCTHLESNTYVDPQVPVMGNPLRWEQVEKLIPFLENYRETYGMPVILGGDVNSRDYYTAGTYSAAGGSVEVTEDDMVQYHTGEMIPRLKSALEFLKEAGYTNAYDTALSRNEQCSCHGYPTWSSQLGAFVGYNAVIDDNNYLASIDHIYVLDEEDAIEEIVYRHIADKPILCSSDHKPVMLDFNCGKEAPLCVNASYSIVYPEESVNAAVYPAITLQNLFLEKGGFQLPLKSQSSPQADAKEILICEDSSMETGHYRIEVQNNRLVITAGDMFGFIGAADYLTEDVFATGGFVLSNDCNYDGCYERETLTRSAGENRVIFHNVWFRSFGSFNSPTSYQYELALVAAYQPDVIGFNEFWSGWRSCGFIEAMAELGYVEAQPIVNGRAITNLGDSVFYNTNTTELIEGSAKYLSYGRFNTTDSDHDGIREPVLRENGKYYDNSDYRDLCATVASFRDKSTGEEYSICCTHLESNTYVDPQVAVMGNPLRWEEVEKLIPFLQNYRETYGVPIILGGDMNSMDSYPPGPYTALGGSLEVTEVSK